MMNVAVLCRNKGFIHINFISICIDFDHNLNYTFFTPMDGVSIVKASLFSTERGVPYEDRKNQ